MKHEYLMNDEAKIINRLNINYIYSPIRRGYRMISNKN
jgi:hypothetical protein